jgi:hypothetical protein
MPRLTHNKYCEHRSFLWDVWQHHMVVYGNFTPREQWDLHAYFAPTKKMSDAELWQYRKEKTEADPSLPQRAGKVMPRFYDEYHALKHAGARVLVAAAGSSKRRGKADRRVTVNAVVKPEIDMDSLKKAMRELVRQLKDEELARQGLQPFDFEEFNREFPTDHDDPEVPPAA